MPFPETGNGRKDSRTTKFREYLEAQLKDPEFKQEYDTLEFEYLVKQLLITIRTDPKAVWRVIVKRLRNHKRGACLNRKTS